MKLLLFLFFFPSPPTRIPAPHFHEFGDNILLVDELGIGRIILLILALLGRL